MCVVSMIYDHFSDKWDKKLGEWVQPDPPVSPVAPNTYWYPPLPTVPAITPEEIAEFRKLLERAREYDKKHQEPECQDEQKKETLLKLAGLLGIKIDFL